MVVTPPGPRSQALAKRMLAVESPAFEARRATREAASDSTQAPIAYDRGLGSNVWDLDGNRYVDLVAGFGALPLGHAHPALRAAMDAQADRLWLALGDVYASEIKAELCARLAALHPEPGARVMLGLSGADAVTCALKTAVLATGKPGVLAFSGSYHGLSYAPLAACGLNEAFREPFRAQLGDHVTFAPYPANDSDLDECMLHVQSALGLVLTTPRSGRAISTEIGAVLVEPILGRGGCVVPPDGFLPALRQLCDRAGALLVVDEIWTGIGRCGAWLVSSGVTPDLVCIGKALGGGLPISACLGTDAVMRAWGKHGGSTIHTATHFGWPLACATAMATLTVIEERHLLTRAADVGNRLRMQLKSAGFSARGRGMMVGVEFEDSVMALRTMRSLLTRGYVVLTGGPRGNVITLTPALDIDESLLEGFVDSLKDATLQT